MNNTIREIIGENREKYFVNHSDSLKQTITYMRNKNIGAVAICERDKVVGVFSERDIVRHVILEDINLEKVSVKEVMTSPVHWISMDERYEVAKAIMVDKGHRHLVVKDEQLQFRGFVSARELLEADLKDSRDLVGKLNDDYYEHKFKP